MGELRSPKTPCVLGELRSPKAPSVLRTRLGDLRFIYVWGCCASHLFEELRFTPDKGSCASHDPFVITVGHGGFKKLIKLFIAYGF